MQRIDNGGLVERAVMDYVIVEKCSGLVDVNVPRGYGLGVCDHFLGDCSSEMGGYVLEEVSNRCSTRKS